MKLKQSRDELDKAIITLEKLKTSNSLEEYESLWRDFLNYLEKCWKKSERECQFVKNKFQPWQGKFKNLRKNDSLLKYLKNARDADVHSIQEIVEKKKSKLTTKFANPNGGFIKKMIVKNGIIQHYEGDEMIFEFIPGKVKTKSFSNNNQIYTIPFYHRGKRITNPENPLKLGKLGIEFYSNFLQQIEEKF